MKRLLALWPYVRPQRGLFLLAVALGGVAGAASGFGVPFFLQTVFRRFFEDPPGAHPLRGQLAVAALLPAVFLARGVAWYFNQQILNVIGSDALQRLRQQLFEKLQALPVAYFDRQSSGDLIARLSADAGHILHAVGNVTKELLLQPFIFAGGLGYLVYLSVREQQAAFLALLLVFAPLVVVPVTLIGRKLRRRSREVQQAFGRVTAVLAENLQAVAEVRAFNLQAQQAGRFHAENAAFRRFYLKMTKYYLLTQPLLELLAVVILSVCFLYSYRQGLGLSVFLAIGGALYFTLDAFKRLVRAVNDLQRAEGAFVRLEAVLAEPDSLPDPAAPRPLGDVRGRIEFDGVSLAYGGAPALREVSVVIAPGTVCALVGPSGAGKTTFARLVLRFYDPQAGTVRLDGVDVRAVRQHDLRGHIAYVPQMPFLFDDTVANNLRLGRPDATDAEVEAAARAAHAHEFIAALPEGYATRVGENGQRLSGGQRQRLALARAFLRRSPVVILDEASSALDAESEQRVQDALHELVRGRTVLIIAHRFSTIQRADRVLLFEAGRIVADGPLKAVFGHPTFRRLYENQVLPAPR